jgi:alkanesulfonate monooxygenase SsuD/methylene tetrahydromethanopterin reductase-like flavin-dependent oxidoreductase (luciferase family)
LRVREGKHRKKIQLAVDLPAVEHGFGAITQLAQLAERGLFDFVFSERPDAFTVLAALAGVTERIGLVAAVDTTAGEPFDVARQLATLDHLSDGRAGWGVADVDGAAEFVTVAQAFWDSWRHDAVLADIETGIYTDPARIGSVEHHGPRFDVRGMATLPAGPQGHPMLLALNEFPTLTVAPADPDQIATEMERRVQSGACAGFILAPDGLDEFVAGVVPLLQERGVFRTE